MSSDENFGASSRLQLWAACLLVVTAGASGLNWLIGISGPPGAYCMPGLNKRLDLPNVTILAQSDVGS